jgi:hypothetical protein
MVENAAGRIPTPANRRRRLFGSPESERLSSELDEFAVELDRNGQLDADWAVAARALLERAMAEQAAGRYGSGWSMLNAARREVIESFDAIELEIATQALRLEAGEKLSNWRGPAVEALLKPNSDSNDTAQRDVGARKRHLKEARRLLDEHLSNNYWKIDVLRQEAMRAGTALAVVLALTVGALVVRANVADDAEFLAWPWDVVVVMVLGALGASVSGVLAPLSADRARRMPDLRAQTDLGRIRPFVGAGAALIVVTVLRSGLGGVEIDAAAVPAAAMIAGFSERFLGQSVSAASAAIGR